MILEEYINYNNNIKTFRGMLKFYIYNTWYELNYNIRQYPEVSYDLELAPLKSLKLQKKYVRYIRNIVLKKKNKYIMFPYAPEKLIVFFTKISLEKNIIGFPFTQKDIKRYVKINTKIQRYIAYHKVFTKKRKYQLYVDKEYMELIENMSYDYLN